MRWKKGESNVTKKNKWAGSVISHMRWRLAFQTPKVHQEGKWCGKSKCYEKHLRDQVRRSEGNIVRRHQGIVCIVHIVRRSKAALCGVMETRCHMANSHALKAVMMLWIIRCQEGIVCKGKQALCCVIETRRHVTNSHTVDAVIMCMNHQTGWRELRTRCKHKAEGIITGGSTVHSRKK